MRGVSTILLIEDLNKLRFQLQTICNGHSMLKLHTCSFCRLTFKTSHSFKFQNKTICEKCWSTKIDVDLGIDCEVPVTKKPNPTESKPLKSNTNCELSIKQQIIIPTDVQKFQSISKYFGGSLNSLKCVIFTIFCNYKDSQTRKLTFQTFVVLVLKYRLCFSNYKY